MEDGKCRLPQMSDVGSEVKVCRRNLAVITRLQLAKTLTLTTPSPTLASTALQRYRHKLTNDVQRSQMIVFRENRCTV